MSQIPLRPQIDMIHWIAFRISRHDTYEAMRAEYLRRYPGQNAADWRRNYRLARQGVETGQAVAALPGHAPLSLASEARERPQGPVRVMVRVPIGRHEGELIAPIISVPAQWDWTVDEVLRYALDEVAGRHWLTCEVTGDQTGLGPLPGPFIVGPVDFPGPTQL